MHRQLRRAIAALIVLALGATASACGSSDDEASAAGGDGLTTVRPVVIEGAQQFPLTVMDSQGFAAKHGIKVDPIKVASPEAAYTQFQTDDFQLGLGAWTKAAQMRAAGKHLTNAYGVTGYTNDVLVKSDSPIKSIADLKGKKIGLFGGPGSGTSLLFQVEAEKYFGFDPMKDAKVFYGAPPLLLGQLQKGELDAVLLLDPLISNVMTQGGLRSVGNLAGIWREKTGQNPLLVTVTLNEDWAKKNPEAAKGFVAAFAEAQRYIKTHKEVWPKLAASVGITSQDGIELLRKRTADGLSDTWNDDVIQQQLDFAKQVNATLGETPDFPSEVPEGTFTTAYAPGAGA
jgi:NitT/TauT family transport system substrate-binding protein